MLLRFVRSESTFSYFDALHLYFAAQGRPVAFYFDKHTVFHVANQFPKSGRMMTQFGRALNTLKMKIFAQTALRPKAVSNVRTALYRTVWSKNSGWQTTHNLLANRAPMR